MFDKSLLLSFLSGVIIPLVLHFAKEKNEKRKRAKIDKLKEEVQFSSLIQDKLEILREEYNADRIWLEQFHNGGSFYPTGRSIQKFSMFYESVAPNIDSIKMQFQSIPVNLFNRSINELLINDIISIPDFKDEKFQNFGLKYVAETTGSKSGYMFAVKTIDSKFIGVLGVEYVKKKNELTNQQLNDLLVETTSIGGVLINHLKK
jgi:hypothetical protein